MIVSASRRTDLPAYYADWLCRRFSEGYVLVRNPFRPGQVSRLALTEETVDGLVFWTKNPLPLARHLAVFRPYPYYFQWTLTPYGAPVEPGLPDKRRLVSAFRELAERIGPDRLVWRYDPVLLSPEWTAARHIEAFGALCRALAGSTDTCIVSFLDRYRHCEPAFRRLCIRPPDEAERAQLLAAFRKSAAACGLTLRACCEEESGLPPASCIDAERLARLGGFSLPVHQDRSQRRGCTCAEAVDIGAYGTCPAGCAYCYATDPFRPVCRFSQESPVAGVPLTGADHIKDRAMPKRRRPVSPSLFPEL